LGLGLRNPFTAKGNMNRRHDLWRGLKAQKNAIRLWAIPENRGKVAVRFLFRVRRATAVLSGFALAPRSVPPQPAYRAVDRMLFIFDQN
jgi:hypothetical protein